MGFQCLRMGSTGRMHPFKDATVQLAAGSPVAPIPRAAMVHGTHLLPFLTTTAAECHVELQLCLVLMAIASGVKRISLNVRSASINGVLGAGNSTRRGSGDKQIKLDIVSNDILTETLRESGCVSAVVSEEEDGMPVLLQNAPYVVCMDPLDGSSNVDCSVPTGSIFGVYRNRGSDSGDSALQHGDEQLASGYCLFSHQTILCLTLGKGTGTHLFTLDPATGDFILTHKGLRIPQRGSTYSLNEARCRDWSPGLRRYIDDVKRGRGQLAIAYNLVYVCSLVADVHYVMLRGGMACNPRSHLRLVYEGNPIALLVEEAGGLASTGAERILSIKPQKVHQRIPCFFGSKEDIEELHFYHKHHGGVQQLGDKIYS